MPEWAWTWAGASTTAENPKDTLDDPVKGSSKVMTSASGPRPRSPQAVGGMVAVGVEVTVGVRVEVGGEVGVRVGGGVGVSVGVTTVKTAVVQTSNSMP